MIPLNYHHLYYFYLVAREGTIARASKVLRLSQPTISGQIRALENALDEKLFVRVGRTLELTETGRVVFRYAEEIFSIGKELQDTLKGRPTGRPLRLHVGISDVVPKLIAYRVLEPALRMGNVQLITSQDNTSRLLAQLSVAGLDLVLSDAPIEPGSTVRAFNHLLGECDATFFGREDVVRALRGEFPSCLDGAPLLVPGSGTVLRRSLESFFERNGIRPQIVGEFADSALMKVFGQHGEGIFPVPSVIANDVAASYAVVPVGRAEQIRERFYAISVERRIKHPAAMLVYSRARSQMFA